jgi:hypothetical protein
MERIAQTRDSLDYHWKIFFQIWVGGNEVLSFFAGSLDQLEVADGFHTKVA